MNGCLGGQSGLVNRRDSDNLEQPFYESIGEDSKRLAEYVWSVGKADRVRWPKGLRLGERFRQCSQATCLLAQFGFRPRDPKSVAVTLTVSGNDAGRSRQDLT